MMHDDDPAGRRSRVQGEAARRALVAYIDGYWREHGYAPSVREMARALSPHASGLGRVTYHLAVLRSAGRIAWAPRVARSVRLAQGAS